MNEFDQFIKHTLKAKRYIRYADDFVIMSEDRIELQNLLPRVEEFLKERLRSALHPSKVFLKTLASGVDFLGWVHFPNHRVLRTATKRRMIRRIEQHPTKETIASYEGMLRHGNVNTLREKILTQKDTRFLTFVRRHRVICPAQSFRRAGG